MLSFSPLATLEREILVSKKFLIDKNYLTVFKTRNTGSLCLCGKPFSLSSQSNMVTAVGSLAPIGPGISNDVFKGKDNKTLEIMFTFGVADVGGPFGLQLLRGIAMFLSFHKVIPGGTRIGDPCERAKYGDVLVGVIPMSVPCYRSDCITL
jgi:hypothetical protein